MALGITAWGPYVPGQRLDRGAIAATPAWMAPALKSLAKGRRAYCSWDEDVVTMAVEAARTCLGAQDLGGSQRAGVAALAVGLERASDPTLIIASERPRARPASVQEMQYGA